MSRLPRDSWGLDTTMAIRFVFLLFLVLGLPQISGASTILSPVAVGAKAGDDGRNLPGLGVWYITGMYNQYALTSTFTSGVSDFDTYVATNPVQNTGNNNAYMWWSKSQPNLNWDPTSVILTFNLGDVYNVDRILFLGVRGFGDSLFSGSTDGVNYTPLSLQGGSSNISKITSFSQAHNLKYIRLEAECSIGINGCQIGEVAFSVATVPLPAGLPLMLTAIGSIAILRRRG